MFSVAAGAAQTTPTVDGSPPAGCGKYIRRCGLNIDRITTASSLYNTVG